MSINDPYFNTPLVKSLLIKPNKLRRSEGQLDEATSLAQRIHAIIARIECIQFTKLAHVNNSGLGAAFKGKSNKDIFGSIYDNIIHSPDIVNCVFATIATADDNNVANNVELCNFITAAELSLVEEFSITGMEIEPLLRMINPKSIAH